MLIRQTILYLPAQLIGPLCQFIAAVAWTHYLAPAEFGVLAYVMAAQELAFLICLGWWSQYMLRYIGDFIGASGRAHYQNSENAILAMSALLQAVVITFLTFHVSMNAELIAAAIFYCLSRTLTSHLAERARSAGAIAKYTVAQTLGPVAGFGLAFIAVSQIEPSAKVALAAFAIAQVPGLLWLWRELRLGVGLAWPDPDILRRAIRFGAPLLIAGAIGWFSFNGIRVIVEEFGGPVAVGLVSVGWGLGQRLAAVIAMLVTAAAFPLAVKFLQAGKRDEALLQVSISGAILFALIAPSCVGVVAITRPLVELMIAEPYQAITFSVLPLAIIAGALRNLRVHTADQVVILFEATGQNVIINLVEVVATVVFCILGLLYGGLAGAAAGCLAGTIVGFIFGFAVAMRRFGFEPHWSELGRIVIATAFMTFVLFVLPFGRLNVGLVTQISVEIAVGALAYLLALAALFPAYLRAGFRMLSALRSATP